MFAKRENVRSINAATSNNLFVYCIYTCALLALLAGVVIIKKGEDVLFLNGMHTPLLDDAFRTVTNLGDGLIFIPIFIATLFISFRHTITVVSICLSSGIICSILKQLIFEEALRPKSVLAHDLLYFVPGVEVYGSHSFPSGHTTTAFCAAVFLALLTRNHVIGIICLLFALLVGASRIYLLQHFLIDVSAGAILGTFITYAAWQIVENLPSKEWMNRKIRFNKPGQKRTTSRMA
jgi:membrane-associated phospholipid phosphatase